MTGPEHWREADLILADDRCSYGCPHTGCPHEMAMLASAQVHATLAAAAVNAEALIFATDEASNWKEVLA